MFYKLYIREGCCFCKRAVDFLTKHKIEYVVLSQIDTTELIEEAKIQYDWPTVPIVVEVDGDTEKLIGGYVDMRKYFKNKGVKNV
jgi:glutaredoxin